MEKKRLILDREKYLTEWKRNIMWDKPFLIERGISFSPAAAAQEEGGNVAVYRKFLANWEPWVYTNWIEECMSWKETCYIGDWSSLVKFHLKGPDTIKFYTDVCANNISNWAVGQAKHGIMCNEDGKVAGEGVVMRLGEDEIISMGSIGYWSEYRLRTGNYNATGRQVGPERFVLSIQGPNSIYLLEKVTGESLRDIKFMRFRNVKIDDMQVIIVRTGMSGELGYELHGPCELASEVHRIVYEAGQEFGIKRLGGRAKQVNHAEACFPTNGFDYVPAVDGVDESVFENLNMANLEFRGTFGPKVPGGSFDYDHVSALYRNPYELGWKKVISFDHDFTGRKALEKEAAQPRRDMVTLVWNAEDVIDVYASLFSKGDLYEFAELPRNFQKAVSPDRVLKDGKLVGISTARCYSVYFREMISLCTLDINLCQPGTEVNVVWGQSGKRQKDIRARVAPAPYKKDNRRIDVTKLPEKLSI